MENENFYIVDIFFLFLIYSFIKIIFLTIAHFFNTLWAY